VLEDEVLVFKVLKAPDTRRAGAVTVEEVSALAHKLGNLTYRLSMSVVAGEA
jgi:hypothetical protein